MATTTTKKNYKSISKRSIPKASIVASFAVLAGIVWWISIRPSNDRNWATDQAVLPEAAIKGNLIHLKNIRNFTYRTTENYIPRYYDKTVDLNKIKRVYYIVEPFSDFKGAAHTFLSFEFDGPEFIAISVEIRKEQGESFSALKGLFKQYEIMYVIADEKDAIKLRSNYRKDDVFIYPIKTTKERIQKLFFEMVQRANKLKTKPEFYNTLFNTCTTNIVHHVNTIVPGRVPFDPRILLPGYSDELAYELGLIDTDLSFADARQKYHINERAEQYANDPNFSVKVRVNY